jgi:hypothetical protein
MVMSGYEADLARKRAYWARRPRKRRRRLRLRAATGAANGRTGHEAPYLYVAVTRVYCR